MSCIQNEAPNAEADIETCTVTPSNIFKREPRVENDRVILFPKAAVDVTSLTLEFTLTPGATITPPSGTIRDFTTPQTYTVTSEDGKWEKTYPVLLSWDEIKTEFDFEHSELVPSGKYEYYRFYEMIDGNRQDFWDSGNPLAVILFGSKGKDAFPTVSYENGKSGKCLKLETKSTGGLGAIMKMYLAAGNLFIGELDTKTPLREAIKATHFGMPFAQEPLNVTGYYKYKSGEKFTNEKNQVVPDKKDIFDIYAILFELDDEVQYLNGENSLTSPNLVSVARIEETDKIETDEWTYFDIPFKLQPGKKIDSDKLYNYQYAISLVFSSSIDGARFIGAAGSTLYVDEVVVHCRE